MTPWIAVTLALAASDLFWEKLPRAPITFYDRVWGPVLEGIRRVHGGLVGDYVTWLVVGLAIFGVVATF